MTVGVGPLVAVEGQHSAERRDRVIALRCRTNPDGVAPLIYTVVNAADYDLIRGAGLKVFAQWSFSNKSKTKK